MYHLPMSHLEGFLELLGLAWVLVLSFFFHVGRGRGSTDMGDTSGWRYRYTYPSEKYESQLGLLFPIYMEKNVPNHQPYI